MVKVIKAKPLINLNQKISIQGESMSVNAKIGLDDMSDEEMSDPAKLVSHLIIKGQLLLSQSFFQKMIAFDATNADAQKLMFDQTDKQLQGMVQMGFLKSEGNSYKSDFEWKTGQLAINGQPMPIPMGAMMGGFMGGGGLPPNSSLPDPSMPVPEGSLPTEPVPGDQVPALIADPLPPTKVSDPAPVVNNVPTTPGTVEKAPSPREEPKQKPVDQQNFFKQDR